MNAEGTATTGFGREDPNQVYCETCESEDAVSFCCECQQFLGAGCAKSHSKIKFTASHQLITLEVALSDRNSTRSTVVFCQRHAAMETSTFCATCELAVCAQCALEAHTKHDLRPVHDAAEGFQTQLKAGLTRVAENDAKIVRSLELVCQGMDWARLQARESEAACHAYFEKLRGQLNDREAELSNAIESSKHRQEKELSLRKSELEFAICGFRQFTAFTSTLLRDGSPMEVVLSSQQVLSRLLTLSSFPTTYEPTWDSHLQFVEGEDPALIFRGLGAIATHDISLAKSHTRRMDTLQPAPLNRPFAFQVVLLDSQGQPLADRALAMSEGASGSASSALGTPGTPFLVSVTLGASTLTADVIPSPKGPAAMFYVTFTPNQPGRWQVAVTLWGKNLVNSPFSVEVTGDPVYRRDFRLVGHTVLRLRDKGSGDGQFDKPCCIATTLQGDIVVVDTFNHRVQVFDRNGGFLFKFGSMGSGNGQFKLPVAVVCSRKGEILVADTGNHRIQVFDQKGTFVFSFGSKGKAQGQFSQPSGMALDRSGNLMVVDRGNHRLQWFSLHGNFVRKFGGEDHGQPTLTDPIGVGVFSNGGFVVSERTSSKILAFTNDRALRWVVEDACRTPFHLFVDSEDNVLVADCNNHAIKIISAGGDRVESLTQIQLLAPTGVCMDTEGRVVVCEQHGHGFSIF